MIWNRTRGFLHSVLVYIGTTALCMVWQASPTQAKPSTLQKPRSTLKVITCNTALRRKRYAQAARCFDNLFRQMPASSRLNAFQKKRKGLYAKRVVLALKKIVDLTAKDPTLAPHARHARISLLCLRALTTLRQALQEKLYVKQHRRRQMLRLQQALEHRIGWSTLTLQLALPPKSQAVLEGSRYRTTLTRGRHKLKLRPGRYTLHLLPMGRTLAQTIDLSPHETRTFSWTWPGSKPRQIAKAATRGKAQQPPPRLLSPKRSPGTEVTAWILGGLGIATAITGGTLLGIGYQHMAKSHEISMTPTQQVDASTVLKLHEEGQSRSYQGWLLTGVGVGMTGVGVLLWWFAKRRHRPAPSVYRPLQIQRKQSQHRKVLYISPLSSRKEF